VSCPIEGPDAQIVVTKISPVNGLWASATGAYGPVVAKVVCCTLEEDPALMPPSVPYLKSLNV